MIKRIVDVSERAYLRVENRQMVISKGGEEAGRIPVEDLGVVMLAHPAIVVTQSLVVACQKNNVALVFCDEKHLPYSLLLPISDGNRLHQKILRRQIEASKVVKKNIWKQIVVQKIQNQSYVLELGGKEYKHVRMLAKRVRSGDPANTEAVAARKYWSLLFGSSFRRDRESGGVNGLLNYGYAVIRSMIARAVVGGGLHPALGIKHGNQYNGLCLADDLMEPIRPWVDWSVMKVLEEGGSTVIDRENKRMLLGIPGVTVEYKGRRMPLMVACHHIVSDFKSALSGDKTVVTYPGFSAMSV